MTTEIKAKYSSPAALTITLASLASSTAGAGRQSTLVDNSTTRYQRIRLYGKITQGTSPTGNRGVYVFAIFGDGTRRSDGAGASDAALTVLNALRIAVAVNKSAPSTGDVLYFDAIIDDPGPEWGVAITHDTGVNLDSTAGNHYVYWIGINPEGQ